MSESASSFVPLPSQPVSGFPAHVFAVLLRRHVEAEMRDYSPARRAEAFVQLAGIEAAAEAYRRASRARVVADCGNRQPPMAPVAEGSDQIDTKELARMLGVQERQARNVGRAAQLGRLVGGRWVWSRAATSAYLDERESA